MVLTPNLNDSWGFTWIRWVSHHILWQRKTQYKLHWLQRWCGHRACVVRTRRNTKKCSLHSIDYYQEEHPTLNGKIRIIGFSDCHFQGYHSSRMCCWDRVCTWWLSEILDSSVNLDNAYLTSSPVNSCPRLSIKGQMLHFFQCNCEDVPRLSQHYNFPASQTLLL